MRAVLKAVLGLAASLAAATPAHALLCGSILDPLKVTVSNVAFGDYTATTLTPVQITGTVSLACNIPIDVLPSFTIALSTGGSGSYAPRRLAAGAGRLEYNLYTDENHTIVWGDGSNGTVTQTVNGTLLSSPNTNFTVHGLLPAGQWSRAALYQDTIVVTVTY